MHKIKAAKWLPGAVAAVLLVAGVAQADPRAPRIGDTEYDLQVISSTAIEGESNEVAMANMFKSLETLDGLAKESAGLKVEDISAKMVQAAKADDMESLQKLAWLMSAKMTEQYVTPTVDGIVRTANVASSTFVITAKDKKGGVGILHHVHNICNMDVIHAAAQYSGRVNVMHIAYCLEPDTVPMRYRAEAHVLESTQTRELIDFRKNGSVPGLFRPRVIDDRDYATSNQYAYRLGSQTWIEWSSSKIISVGASGWPMVNKAGNLFPLYRHDSRPDYVHVPYQPFNPIRDNDLSEFRRNCETYYRWMGWSYPEGDFQNHHMKPSRWGGSNAGSNCYRMPTSVHQLMFNAWWGSGNYNFETPISH